jgi:hypothetical protein
MSIMSRATDFAATAHTSYNSTAAVFHGAGMYLLLLLLLALNNGAAAAAAAAAAPPTAIT